MTARRARRALVAGLATLPALAWVAGCSFSPSGGAGGDDDGGPIDGAVIDAHLDASPIDAPIDVPADACVPLCVGNDIESCGAVVESCALGCSTTGTVHCKYIVASNGVNEADDLAGADADLRLMANRLYVFDTDTGEIRHYALDGSGGGAMVRAGGVDGLDPASKIRFRTIDQPTPPGSSAPPDLAVFGVRSLTIPPTAVLRPIGARAAALVARGSIDVGGEIDVGGGRVQSPQGAASITIPGPGGGRGALSSSSGAQGCAAGGNGQRNIVAANQQRDTGGGGGGLGTAGGRGGRASLLQGGGSAVDSILLQLACSQANLTPLRGGSGGGCSRDGGGGDVSAGGGGGGVLQLTSFHSIVVTGTLYAGGAGGTGDAELTDNGADGGGGAGAGGGILVEAPRIKLEGASVTATGGGGGAGNNNVMPGQSGQRSGAAAAPTGNGGRGATGPNAGGGEVGAEDGTGDVDGTGGGGGGAGIIHLRSIEAPTIAGSPVIRPGASTSTAATTP